MIISVTKDNVLVSSIDLTQDVQSIGNGESVFYIGRAKDCTVCLDDRAISRIQAELHLKAGKWRLVSTSSFSDLMINGNNSKDHQLKTGDRVVVGPFTLSFSFSDIVSQTVEEELDQLVEEEPIVEEEVTETQIEETPLEDISEEPIAADEEIPNDLEDDSDLGDPSSDLEGEGTSEFSSDEEPVAEAASEEPLSFDDGNDEFAMVPDDDDGSEDSGDSTRVMNTFVELYFEISGEHAPYDKFILDKKEVYVGRDPAKCQLVINDPEISSVHAVIRKNNITCSIEDLQSANGTLVNGEAINKIDLSNGDEVLLGATTLTLKIKSDFFKQEEDRLMPVEEDQEIEVQEVVEVDEDFEDTGMQQFGEQAEAPKSGGSLFSKEALKDPQKRKKLIYIVVGLLLLLLLLDEEPKKPTPPKTDGKDDKSRLLDGQNADQTKVATDANEKPLSPEELAVVDSTYLLAKELIDVSKFAEALIEIDKIKRITPNYKNTLQLEAIAKQKIKELEALAKQQREEEERKIRMEKVKLLVGEAKEATEKKQVQLAEGLFAKIIELDPENFEVSRLKLEIDAYKKEQERIEIEKAAKEAERKRQLDALAPGKGHYLSGEWYKAIQRLQTFLLEKSIDEDLRDEATKMLTESKDNLNNIIQPMLGKARSLKEGQDLKGAYEQYNEILKIDQGSNEALNEMDAIRDILTARAKKVYREAIISESLSLFEDAKEKFKEVQQIAPVDSEYYEKATNRLKEYLD